MILRALLVVWLAAFATAAAAQPLTIRAGESWAFSIRDGQPVRAHRVKPTAKPGRGEIKATLTSLAGTTLTLTNNSATSYSFRAELVGVRTRLAARTCTLPPNMKPALEYWPRKAAAVRLSNFRATNDPGTCPATAN